MAQHFVFYLGSLTLRSFCIAWLGGAVAFSIRSAALRHAVWVAVLFLTLLTPAADLLLPAHSISVPAGYAAVRPLSTATHFMSTPLRVLESSRPPEPARVDAWAVASILYAAVAAVLLIRLIHASRKLRDLKTKGRRVVLFISDEFGKLPDIYESSEVRVPLTAGFARPWITLPADWRGWSDWKLRAVLSHELTHIRRGDWIVAMIAALGTCVFWFNPLTWWLERHLSTLSEKAADEASIRFTGDAPRYAEVLLDFAAAAQTGRRSQIGVVPMAARRIRSRIERVLSMKRAGRGFVRRSTWLFICLLSAPVLYAASALGVAPPVHAVALESTPQVLGLPQPASSVQPELQSAPRRSSSAGVRITQANAEPAGISQKNNSQDGRPGVQPNSEPASYMLALAEYYRTFAQYTGVQKHLEKLEREYAGVRRKYTARHPESVQLQSEINRLRSELAGIASPNSGGAMVFDHVQDRTVFFKSADGAASFSYGCADCAFFLGSDHIGGGSDDGTPGALIRLGSDGKQLDITCRAGRCHVVVDSGDATELQFGQSTAAPTERRAVILFN